MSGAKAKAAPEQSNRPEHVLPKPPTPQASPAVGVASLQAHAGNAVLAAASASGSIPPFGESISLQSGFGNAAIARSLSRGGDRGAQSAGQDSGSFNPSIARFSSYREVSQSSPRTIQRQPASSSESETSPANARRDEKVDVTQLKYACVFVGHDLYGVQARRYIKTVMLEHTLIEASSMEDAIVKIRDHSRAALKGGAAARIAEVVLIAHGNASGFLKIPLVPGHKGITPEKLGKLQDDFKAGARKKFQEARADVLGLFNERTQVIVRGCRIGRSQETVDALAAFFGGQATVYAPKEYQAFTRRRVSSFDNDPRQAAIKAFDHLAMQGFLPKEVVATDDEKVRWVAAHLPGGFVPETFLVDEPDVEKVRHAGADEAAIQGLKDYMSAQMIGLEKWGVSTPSGPRDEELDPMGTDEIVKLAADYLRELRLLEQDEPDNWYAIGDKAWWVLRCHYAWSRKPEAMQIKPEERDPIAGLWMPGLSYDTNLLAMQAGKRPDLKVPHADTFATANLVMPAAPPSEEVERLDVTTGQTPGQPPGPSGQPSAPSGGPGGGGKAAPGGEITLEPAQITPTPPMPKPPLDVDLGGPGGQKPDTALVVRDEFKRQFDIKYQRQLGYLKVKKAVVELNGKIDFKGEGKKELVIGAFGALATKPGESVRGGGSRLEKTLAKAEDKQTSVSGKVTGGLELGGQGRTKEGQESAETQRGLKVELYLGAQVAWGPIAQEFKLVIVGIDETKQGTDMWTILNVKWSPIVVQGDFDLPVSDGTKVKFVGAIKLTIEAEPDWAKIAARLAQAMGRQVVVSESVVVLGGAAVTGAGAAGAGAGGAVLGEVVIVGGFVAAAALLVYAYYKSAQEIEDLKELQRGADQGVTDFCGGYLAYLGIAAGGQASGALWKEGQRHAEINLKARVKRAAHRSNERYQGKLDKPFGDDDPDLRAAVLGGVRKDAESWRQAVYFTYETAVRTLFYKAWLARVQGTAAERNALYARARAGLASVEPTDEPDYDWVNAVGASAGAGIRPPKHRR